MPIVINGSGTLTGLSVGGLEDGIITPAELSTGAPSWDSNSNLTNVASINNGALAGMRNRIINGGMDIAQRGTSFAAIAATAYSMDRWRWGQDGAMVCTVSQSTDVPNNTFQSSYKVDVTTVDSSIAAGDYALVSQGIEGYNVRDLIGTTFTLSFWVKSPKTGTHCVAFRNGGFDRSYVKEYTIAAANTWEYKTLTVSGGLITSGTWNWTNSLGLNVGFALAIGTTFQTTADAWQTGNFIATANQVNVMDNTANEFFITGVQLEPGAVATPFERRIHGQELALCQRYYQKSYNINIAPGTTGDPTEGLEYQIAGASSVGFLGRSFALQTSMRTSPTFTTYDRAVPPNVGKVTTNAGNNITPTIIVNGQRAVTVYVGSSASELTFHWTASAEL